MEIDLLQLRQIAENFRNKAYVQEKLQKLLPRIKSRKATRFVPSWWADLKILCEFDNKPLNDCHTFEKVVNYYTSDFNKLDRAIRNLYAHFIQDEGIIRPLQEHYESLCHELMTRWFEYGQGYKSNQQGFLPHLIKQSQPGMAIIVGDGVRYEIAAYVATSLKGKCKVTTSSMLADMPSETERNMSALYVGNEEVISVQKEREKRLSELTGKGITFLDLEALHYGIKADYLVLTYKDIDSAGEKLQLGAIKLFGEFEKVLSDKIELLLNMGYREVHLVTDHGFVLTGLLDESDKVEPAVTGKKEVHERYIRTTDRQDQPEWTPFERPYGEFNYIYTAKTHKPFKSKGVYGFAHGGFAPQEIIIPHFEFRKENPVTIGLAVSISNKKELLDVTGDIFSLKIQGVGKAGDVFESSRKIQVLLFANMVNICSSSIFTMESGKEQSLEFSFGGHNALTAVIVDATSQEQLDSTPIHKTNARDFGGLL